MSEMKLSLEEVRRIEYILLTTRSQMIEDQMGFILEMFERAHLTGIPLIRPGTPALEYDPQKSSQDQLVAYFLHALHIHAASEPKLQEVIIRAKRECGVQLDVKEVQKSINQLIKEIREEL